VCAKTRLASGATTRATMRVPTSDFLTFIPVSPLSAGRLSARTMCSVRERPEPQLLLRDLPEPRQSVRLDHEEENDQAAEHHELDLLLQRHRQYEPDHVRHVGEEDRDQDDEGGPEEAPEDAAQPADDHHEQADTRAVD